ncbi:MAG TPA: c-type cytochrome [Candidatus Acidoferrales bacterium]|nr:c-type cytochrome [Candidatus Acidoferrales bacterium]
MKGFIWGVFLTIVAGIGVALTVALTGRVSMRADVPPTQIETDIAVRAMDASVERNAPKVANPLKADEPTLVAGAAIYRDHCAACHGDPVHPDSPLEDTLNPPAPQFMTDSADMPDHHNFYITQHGIRWTAMPGWKNALSEQQIWQVVTFLAHMDSLPPAAKQIFTDAQPGTFPFASPAAAASPASAAEHKSAAKPTRRNPHK